MATSLEIQHTIRRVLLTVFVIAEVAGAGGFYLLLRREAIQEAEYQSRMLLSAANSVRTFTTSRILSDVHDQQSFHEITVPSFAAQTVLGHIAAGERAYTYRESALNPTNPSDRATPFEVELARRFQSEPKLTQLSGLTTMGGERAFYVVQPFRITDSKCLACHSTPAAAPAAMIAKYGSSNGFNWHMGETVGVQLLTVPIATRFRNTLQLAALLSAGLLVIFVAAYFALSQTLDKVLVGPLRDLAQVADRASRSEAPDVVLPKGGAKEVADLSAAIERLRTSLGAALKKLAELGGSRS